MERARSSKADAVVFDLEDAVPRAALGDARNLVASMVERRTPSTAAIGIRVNRLGNEPTVGAADIEAVVRPGLNFVVVPKVEHRNDLAVLDSELNRAEDANGMPAGGVKVIPLIETAKGLIRCDEILEAPSSRILTVAFGLGDFSVDIGISPIGESLGLLYARSRIVVAARAAGLGVPLDGPYLAYNDHDGLIRDSLHSRGCGFGGRVLIHPNQVSPVNATYGAVSETDLAFARRAVREFEQAMQTGIGAIGVDGRLVDRPLYLAAKRLIEQVACQ